MPINKKYAVQNDAEFVKKRSPFKDVKELEKEITDYMNKHKVRIKNQASRISDYFEMCCFNYVVKFYERNGYVVSIENLQNGEYRYKCSTQGNQNNFSYFQVAIKPKNRWHRFHVHHNLAVQSSHEEDIYTTPDISVVNRNAIKLKDDFYEGNKQFSYVENEDLITFCEVKQFNPYPELLFNFIGTVNEIKSDIIKDEFEKAEPCHLAPSLMISGKANKHAERIKASLERRYCINVIFDLFDSGSVQFSSAQVKCLRKLEIKPEIFIHQANKDDVKIDIPF